MPCMKCANGKYKYGVHGRCVYDTLKACEDAAAAIHIKEPKKKDMSEECNCPKLEQVIQT